MNTKTKPIEYWRGNASEDYKNTPISVLKYIRALEDQRGREQFPNGFDSWVETHYQVSVMVEQKIMEK